MSSSLHRDASRSTIWRGGLRGGAVLLVGSILLAGTVLLMGTGAPLRAQPAKEPPVDPQLSQVLTAIDPGAALRVGLRESTAIEGTLVSLQGSRLLLRTLETQPTELALSEIVRVDERGVSKTRGAILGALLLGTAGAVTGLFAEILTADNPDNSDLFAASATVGVLGIGLGAVIGHHLDPGRPGGWQQRYPTDDTPPRSDQWQMAP
jgi:hypothetical protein